MRTRRSRLWIVLLHLSCQQRVPSYNNDDDDDRYHRMSSNGCCGIVGVHPWPIGLEHLDARELLEAGNAAAVISNTNNNNKDDDDDVILWLQDRSDGTCLGPTGAFGPCGDATLWRITRLLGKLRMGIFGVDEVATLVSDDDDVAVSNSGDWVALESVVEEIPLAPRPSTAAATSKRRTREKWYNRSRRRRKPRPECLITTSSSSGSNRPGGDLQLETCTSKYSAKWAWRIALDNANDDDVAVENAAADEFDGKHGTTTSTVALRNAHDQCIYRHRQTQQAILGACHRHPDTHADQHTQAIQLSFVRFPATVAATTAAATGSSPSSSSNKSSHDSVPTTNAASSPSPETSSSSSTTSTISTSPPPPPTVSPSPPTNSNFSTRRHDASSLPHPNGNDLRRLDPQHRSRMDASAVVKDSRKKKKRSPFDALLHNTNPILLANSHGQPSGGLHNDHPELSSHGSWRTRPIQVHPYLETAKNEVWTDPETGLEFRTDLCQYLGHTRAERGRHTLTGVGQYKKFVVKVYAVAYYVSKRDVLLASGNNQNGNNALEPFASLSAAELRDRPDFYQALRTMNGFDRTLMIKTNMQLASDTIRSSLHADWTRLTEDAKTLLIDTSLQPRPADETMLALIQNNEQNPSRCSCSQVAHEEYNADPDCCARGTELAFTWTKEGTLEVRLNGQVMERFDRPDIAEGIFFEYFRLDDPMSHSFLERVVDGFPFLLAPLAQIKGLHMGNMHGDPSSNHHRRRHSNGNPIKAMIGGMLDCVVPPVLGMAGHCQRAVAEAAGHAGNGLKQAGDTAQHMMRDVDRRRKWMLRQLSQINLIEVFQQAPGTVMRLMTQDKAETIQEVSEWVSNSVNMSLEDASDSSQSADSHHHLHHGLHPEDSRWNPLARWFSEVYYAPDEIGPMIIHPAHDLTRKVFLALVHMYLLLLFIVSFPGGTYSSSRNSRLMVRRGTLLRQHHHSKVANDNVSETDSDSHEDGISDDNGEPTDDLAPHGNHAPTEAKLCLKKSLSYCL